MLVGWSSGVVCSWSLGVLDLEPLGRDSVLGQGQLLLLPGLGLLARCHKAICGWSLLVVGSEVLGRDCTVN